MRKLIIFLMCCTILLLLSQVTSADLIGHWGLDLQDVPASGQTPDKLGLHHGDYTIGAAGGFGLGQIGYAFYNEMDFNTKVSIADPNNSMTFGTGDFTVAFWVKFTSDNSWGKLHPLFNKYTSNQFDAQPGFVIYAVDEPTQGATKRHLEMYSAAGAWDFQGFYDFNTNQWYHLAFVRSGALLTSYVDGVQLMAMGIGAINLTDGGLPIILGNTPPPHWAPLNGGMDDVRVYNTALTANEIAAIAAIGAITLVESDGSTDVLENGPTSDTYDIELCCPPDPNSNVEITVNYDSAQLSVVPSSLTFTNSGSLVQTVTVTALDDSVVEGPHTSTITHSVITTDPVYASETVSDVVVHIGDNDLLGIVIWQSGDSTDVDEDGPTSDTYTVELGSQPTANVTVTITPDADTTVDTPSITFTTSDWANARTVTVEAVDDGLSEGPEVSTIVHSASGGDYTGITANLSVNVADNEAYCGDGSHGYWQSDINQDCYVNLGDIAVIAGEWLNCSDPFNPVDCTINP